MQLHRLALVQRQVADRYFRAVRLCIVDARMLDTALKAVACDQLNFVQVIAIEIERANDARPSLTSLFRQSKVSGTPIG